MHRCPWAPRPTDSGGKRGCTQQNEVAEALHPWMLGLSAAPSPLTWPAALKPTQPPQCPAGALLGGLAIRADMRRRDAWSMAYLDSSSGRLVFVGDSWRDAAAYIAAKYTTQVPSSLLWTNDVQLQHWGWVGCCWPPRKLTGCARLAGYLQASPQCGLPWRLPCPHILRPLFSPLLLFA